MPTLNDPIRIGDLQLPNRALMSPLTRARATVDRVPTDLMLEYYVQRASAGLIISEATCISPLSVGYERTPGIWSAEQVAGWRRITESVHHARFDRESRPADARGSGRGHLGLGPQRVGLHLSPRADIHSMGDSDLLATFTHVSREMDKRNLAFLLVREHQANDSIGAALKLAFGGVYVANEQFTVAQAEVAITEGAADAVAFGVKFIANPDLPARIKTGAPLNEPDPETFYVGGAKGYVDYPALQRSPEPSIHSVFRKLQHG
jgi:2,4-dienoyl-CoA reductase-like NADH-dependent reductase (Old Yellow Enzyme family)